MRRPTLSPPSALPLALALGLLPALLLVPLPAPAATPAAPGAPVGDPARGEALDVRAPDGTVLGATYWSPGRPGPGVLLLHMCNSDRTAWAGLGPLLAARGMHALALDYRGYGDSGGQRLADFQQQQALIDEKWPGDVDAAFAALRARLGAAEPIFGAAGGSCGVNQAIHLARRHPEVRTLVLLAGNANAAGETFLADNPWLPVFAAAARDDGAAIETTRWMQGFSAHPGNRFAEYADGGHGTEIFAVHRDLEPAIADWFEQRLIAEPVARPAPGSTAAAPRPGPSAETRESFLRPGAAAALRARLAAGGEGGASAPPPEAVINVLGYQRLQEGAHAEAIELFELNAELYPGSANVYDSLADGYLAAGRIEAALQTARKTLEHLPADPAADTAIEQAIRGAAQAKIDELTAPAAAETAGAGGPGGG